MSAAATGSAAAHAAKAAVEVRVRAWRQFFIMVDPRTTIYAMMSILPFPGAKNVIEVTSRLSVLFLVLFIAAKGTKNGLAK